MMIRTNLYPAEFAQRRVRRPGVLVAKIAAAVLLVALVGWQLLRWSVEQAELENAQAKSQEAEIQKELTQAKTDLAEASTVAGRRDAIIGFAKRRQNWAPVLEKILTTIPENVELTRLQTRFVGQEQCTVLVEGRAAANRPRLECDKLRVLLANALSDLQNPISARLAKLEDTETRIRVGDETFPCADFSIELEWKSRPNEQ